MRKPPSLERWAVFVSGRGSNMQAVIDQLDHPVHLVVSNRKFAPAQLRAKRLGVPSVYWSEKNQGWDELIRILRDHKIDWIYLAGFMKILPPSFIECWEGRILNIHPSLLPLFPGLEAIEKSFAAKVDMGVTLHRVIAEMDAGPILKQTKISKTDQLTQAELFISIAEQHLSREVVRKCRI